MKQQKRFGLAILLLILLSFQQVFAQNKPASEEPSGDRYHEIAKNLEIFASLYRELNSYYVDILDPSQIMKIGMDEMLASLDPYTNYISGADIDEYQIHMTGKYGGIGSRIGEINGVIIITEPYEGSPAQKAGLKAGDQILSVDGVVSDGKNSDQISQLLRGEPGTPITIRVKRAISNQELTFNITRAEINISNVPYFGMVNDKIGYIKLDQFTEDAGKNVSDALKALKLNADLKGVILDLRGNPGGLLNEAVNVCNVFMNKDVEIVSTKGKIPDANKSYQTEQKAVDANIPVIVLTDGGSASASEIVSGAIQDVDRGVILGQRTFGKGLVQITRPLPYKAKLKVTTSKYYIPSGRCIQAIDYSHKTEDGEAPVVPDSLRKEFKTVGGRIVKDGAGIEPDVKVEAEKWAPVTIALLNKYHIFNYASLYVQQHPELTSVDNFSFSDEDYKKFVAYLSDKEYDYTTETEEKLKDFTKTTKDEEYYDAVAALLKELEGKINHDKDQDLIKHKDQIIKILEAEIATRIAYEKGRIKVSLKRDVEVQKAVELLLNPSEYAKLLHPQN